MYNKINTGQVYKKEIVTKIKRKNRILEERY